MSEDMSSSWKYISSASSRLSSFRGYISRPASGASPHSVSQDVTPVEGRQGWRAWAGSKIRSRGGGPSDPGIESLSLFPGWAARKYGAGGSGVDDFEVDVFISGYAYSYRESGTASRSQRAFMRLAKGFASLPKLAAEAPSNSLSQTPLSPSTEELLKQKQLPPRPTEIPEDYDAEALERQFQKSKAEGQLSPEQDSPSSSRSTSLDIDSHLTPIPTPTVPPIIAEGAAALLSSADLRRLHANLERRLQPFWSSALSARTIRVRLFPPIYQPDDSELDRRGTERREVAIQDVTTSADGSFEASFKVKWEDMYLHPDTLYIAYGDPLQERDLLVTAELVPPSSLQPSTASGVDANASYEVRQVPQSKVLPRPVTRSKIHITITHSPIRVISDIDDTIKLSGILSGARAVFHNVFVKDLKDNVIPGMGAWYTNMWKRGVRFHYVSNGPFELLPVLNEFFQVSQLPTGSIKLKSYAGRSLFNGLLSAPAIRKRAGIEHVLNAFPDSRFFLIGDTGEQDLELYADLANERPDQILAVLVRDVDSGEPIDDPTGWKAIQVAGTRTDSLIPGVKGVYKNLRTVPGPTGNEGSLSRPSIRLDTTTPLRGGTNDEFFTSAPLSAEPENMAGQGLNTIAPSSASSTSRNSTSSSSSSTYARLSDVDRKRYELQKRVYRARQRMPGRVPLRIFRYPDDCVEVEEILDRERVDS